MLPNDRDFIPLTCQVLEVPCKLGEEFGVNNSSDPFHFPGNCLPDAHEAYGLDFCDSFPALDVSLIVIPLPSFGVKEVTANLSLGQMPTNIPQLQATNDEAKWLLDMNQFLDWPEEPQPCFKLIDFTPVEIAAQQPSMLRLPPRPATAAHYRPIAARDDFTTTTGSEQTAIVSSCPPRLPPMKGRKYCCYECKLSKLEVCG